LGLYQTRKRSVPRRTAAIREATLQKGPRLFLASRPVLSILPPVGFRLRATAPATSIRPLALERWSSILLIPIPQLALQRCYSILPARTTRPLELTHSSTTLLATATPPWVPRRSSLMRAFPATTRLLALRRSSSTLLAVQTPPLVMLRSIVTLRPAATRPWVMMRFCLMTASQTASHLAGTTMLSAPVRSLVTLMDTATT